MKKSTILLTVICIPALLCWTFSMNALAAGFYEVGLCTDTGETAGIVQIWTRNPEDPILNVIITPFSYAYLLKAASILYMDDKYDINVLYGVSFPKPTPEPAEFSIPYRIANLPADNSFPLAPVAAMVSVEMNLRSTVPAWLCDVNPYTTVRYHGVNWLWYEPWE